ncbi:hypothetical protein CSR02_02835 [Acetobacter pomorum]|uniref:Uncharacterized protein n=1 Tax=Acetobacter pomorum TaxID=65959 RepID=A0A2G4RFE6_9PROT|nr:hypothetical protein CSR02_02835 [Acetobacter pomorum]
MHPLCSRQGTVFSCNKFARGQSIKSQRIQRLTPYSLQLVLWRLGRSRKPIQHG